MTNENARKLMEITARSYCSIAPQFSQSRSKSWADCTALARHVNDGDRVLDVGCGNGRLLQSLESKNISYTGVDSNPEFIEIARERYGADGHTFAIGNMTSLDAISELSGATFDTVFCIAALHHLPTEKLRLQALIQMRKRLARGGKLLMANWNLFHLTLEEKSVWKYALKRIKTPASAWSELVGLPKSAFGWRDLPTHWREERQGQFLYYYAFIPGEISRLCKMAGFTQVTSEYSHSGTPGHWWQSGNILTVAYA